MISRWFEYKDKAIALRKTGVSIREIEKEFHIPRSTLSGWFKNVVLTDTQKRKLELYHKEGGRRGREKAVIWHNLQKQNRLLEAKSQAITVLDKIDVRDKYVLELALSMLYLGEGSKSNQTSLGNSNPEIVRFFVRCLVILYQINPVDLKYYLHLRSDQDGEELKKYWSEILKVPIDNFSFTKDKRTVKSKTYAHYKGVCVVHVGKVALQRRLGFISQEFCDKILEHTDS